MDPLLFCIISIPIPSSTIKKNELGIISLSMMYWFRGDKSPACPPQDRESSLSKTDPPDFHIFTTGPTRSPIDYANLSYAEKKSRHVVHYPKRLNRDEVMDILHRFLTTPPNNTEDHFSDLYDRLPLGLAEFIMPVHEHYFDISSRPRESLRSQSAKSSQKGAEKIAEKDDKLKQRGRSLLERGPNQRASDQGGLVAEVLHGQPGHLASPEDGRAAEKQGRIRQRVRQRGERPQAGALQAARLRTATARQRKPRRGTQTFALLGGRTRLLLLSYRSGENQAEAVPGTDIITRGGSAHNETEISLGNKFLRYEKSKYKLSKNPLLSG